MPNWIDLMVAQERYNDMVRENERDLRIAHMINNRCGSIWQRLKRWLGDKTTRTPQVRVLASSGNAHPLQTLREPSEGETGHYLN